MKRVFAGYDNRIKRRICALMAVVITLTTVASVTYLKQQNVEAKETLYSIEKVIKDLNDKNETYTILEIVPDNVSANISFKDLSGNEIGVGISQHMGFLGYYVGGSEPIRSDVDSIVNDKHMLSYNKSETVLMTLSESSTRYNTVNVIYDKLKESDIYNENSGPFSLAEGYKELRQGEVVLDTLDIENLDEDSLAASVISDKTLEMGLADNKYGLMKREKDYVDYAHGEMIEINAGSKAAHYVKKYDLTKADVETGKQDIAAQLLEGYKTYCETGDVSGNNLVYVSDNNFSIYNGDDDNRKGDFDPLLSVESSEAANVYAVFEDLYRGDGIINQVSSGYRVISAEPVNKEALPATGTPIYTFNQTTGRYEYYRDCDDEFRKVLLSSNEVNNSQEVTTESIEVENVNAYAGMTDSAHLSVLTNENISEGDALTEEIDTPNEDDFLTDALVEEGISEDNLLEEDQNEEELVETEEFEEKSPQDLGVEGDSSQTNTTSEFFVLTFAYFEDYQLSDMSEVDNGFYGVKSFKYTDREHGAGYTISIENGTIVPNLMSSGTINVKDECPDEYMVYEYNKNSSLCNMIWIGDEQSTSVNRIRGAKIYYRYGIRNREWFKRFVFDRDYYSNIRNESEVDDETKETCTKLSVRVDTKVASEVNNSDIIGKHSSGHYIYRMITLMAGDASFCVGNESDYKQYTAKNKDISAEVYVGILNRAAESKSYENNKTRMPVIVDHSIIENEDKLADEYKDSLMYNLACVFMFDDVTGYSEEANNNVNNIKSGELHNTALSPTRYLASSARTTLSYNNCVNKNVYIYGRTIKSGLSDIKVNILNLSFDKRFFDSNASAEAKKGFTEVESDIRTEEMFRKSDVSLKPLTHNWVSEATVIRYIIGYGDSRVTEGKGEVTVLELEPVACYDLAFNNENITSRYNSSSEEFKKLAIEEKGEKVIYEGELYYKDKPVGERSIIKQAGLKINLVQMTTAEFIGHIEDLNSTYDLIYIGMNTGGGTLTKMENVKDVKGEWTRITNTNGRENGLDKTLTWHRNYHEEWQEKRQTTGRDMLVPAQGDIYGGLRHRVSTKKDKDEGRAEDVGMVITDYNDDNMDGLVYSNVGDMAYIGDACAGSLKVKTGEDANGNPTYKYLEMNDINLDNINEHFIDGAWRTNGAKGYGYITYTNDPNLGNSKDSQNNIITNSAGEPSNYSLYRTRYSGNDITKEKADALIDFVQAGYPVVLADRFFTSNGSINECTVDNSSYMYIAAKELIQNYYSSNLSDSKNVFKQSTIPENIFQWYLLNLGKPTIEMTEERCKKSQTEPQELKDSDKDGEGYYYAYYRFKIDSKGSAPVSTKYRVGLFIDINADGKYSESNEGIMFSSVRDMTESKRVSQVVDDKGMQSYELFPGHEYEAKCKLSGSFIGCLPWRIRVTQVGNEHRRTNADGIYCIKNKETPINILQIKSRYGGDNWDMKADFDKTDSLFHQVVDNDNVPFTIKINALTGEELANLPEIANKTPDGYYEYLKNNYQMIIMGYKDMYEAPNATVTAGIKQYIADGYSVLFTHDCTSFINTQSDMAVNPNYYNSGSRAPKYYWREGAHWGFEFNSIIRNIVGMDRYDIMDESTHKDKIEKPYKPRSNRNVILDYEAHGFTYPVINFWGYQDRRNVTNSREQSKLMWASKGAREGVENYVDRSNDEVRAYREIERLSSNGSTLLEYNNLKGISIGSGQYAKKVSRVNKGQITQYPYPIKEEIPVATTHAQYYQLDLTADDDNDGESDIVVWYCIAGDSSTRNDDMYRASKNDVRNNYYIYNKGNVTYSGVGHSTVGNREEMELFVNTMVAAYRTGLHAPDLSIVEGYSADAKKASQLYVSYDNQIQKIVSANETDSDLTELNLNKNSDIDNYVDLYFNADQVSLVQNASAIDHNLYAKVFYEDESSDETLGYRYDETGGDYLRVEGSAGKGTQYIKGDYVANGGSYRKATGVETGHYVPHAVGSDGKDYYAFNYIWDGSDPAEAGYKLVTPGNEGTHAKEGDTDNYVPIQEYLECNYKLIRDLEEPTEEMKTTRVRVLPLTEGSIRRADGSSVEIMTDEMIRDTFKEESFSSGSEYLKFDALRSNIEGCAKIKSGVTYKVRVPVDNSMQDIWGGIKKSGNDLRNIKSVYVMVMDFASYRNNQISNEEDDSEVTSVDTDGDINGGTETNKKGKIYKVNMTKWRADSVKLSRVEVFDLD